MTLIVSYINKFGIVMASDSHLTTQSGNAGLGQKLFPIPKFNSCLAFSGTYQHKGKSMDNFLNEFITSSSRNYDSLNELLCELERELNSSLSSSRSEDDITIMYICGFPLINHVSELEHYHISNGNLNKKNGQYSLRDRFILTKDFSTYDSKKNNQEYIDMVEFGRVGTKTYINGFPSGRISWRIYEKYLEKLIHTIAIDKKLIEGQGDWQFRGPKNLFETAALIKLNFHFISEIFKLSNYEAMYVGGETQTYLIPNPKDKN